MRKSIICVTICALIAAGTTAQACNLVPRKNRAPDAYKYRVKRALAWRIWCDGRNHSHVCRVHMAGVWVAKTRECNTSQLGTIGYDLGPVWFYREEPSGLGEKMDKIRLDCWECAESALNSWITSKYNNYTLPGGWVYIGAKIEEIDGVKFQVAPR